MVPVRVSNTLLAVLFVAPVFAGCIVGDTPEEPLQDVLPSLVNATLKDAEGAIASLALIAGLDADGTPLWYETSRLDGRIENKTIGAEVDRLVAWSNGSAYEITFEAQGRADLVLSDTLVDLPHPAPVSERIAFTDSTFPLQLGTTCLEKDDGDMGCGLDEPSIEVDGRGWIYYTAVCCFFVSSPVWVSKDGGATFEPLEHPMKDVYGNEGDLAIDDEGNLYYMDIDLATFGIARWNAELEPQYSYRRPGEPLVDRPWIRAGEGGVVHAIYNTGVDTVYYRSTDHALTFSAAPEARFGSALARAYSDVQRGIVGMVNAGDYMESTDAGVTWGERTDVPRCSADTASVDEAGNVWYQGKGCVIGRLADGNWTKPMLLAPGITKSFTWMGAGAEGAVATAYYGQIEEPSHAEALGIETNGWYLFVSWSNDAHSETPHWAHMLVDPDPLGFDDLGRRLGDFFQTVIGPDGAIHIAYSMNAEMDDSATSVYRKVGPVAGLAPTKPLVGPFA
ncbi:MAG: hypothetical protein KY455_04090 [Euryarchaeota archaeon]|nr:hypothetical protein [Euryarchaeota archaeon]